MVDQSCKPQDGDNGNDEGEMDIHSGSSHSRLTNYMDPKWASPF